MPDITYMEAAPALIPVAVLIAVFVLDDLLIQILIAVVLNIIAYLLSPKAKKAKPEAARDAEVPDSSAGSPIVKMWGTMWFQSANILWWGSKDTRIRKISP